MNELELKELLDCLMNPLDQIQNNLNSIEKRLAHLEEFICTENCHEEKESELKD